MFKPSKILSDSENRNLEILESLLYAAPLSDVEYKKYANLCLKAHRKPHPNW